MNTSFKMIGNARIMVITRSNLVKRLIMFTAKIQTVANKPQIAMKRGSNRVRYSVEYNNIAPRLKNSGTRRVEMAILCIYAAFSIVIWDAGSIPAGLSVSNNAIIGQRIIKPHAAASRIRRAR